MYNMRMNARAKQLMDDVLALPDGEKEQFLDELAIRVHEDEPVDPVWAAEIERRVLEVENGNAGLSDAKDVHKRALAALRDRR